jgi:hypothetical protein
MVIRDFVERRREQMIDAELDRTIKRLFPFREEREMILAIYAQNPLLNTLLRRGKKRLIDSPYTQPIKK